MASPSRLSTKLPWIERFFPNQEWVLGLVILSEIGLFGGTAHNFQRFIGAGGWPDGNADGLGNLRKLFAGGGAVYVGGNDQWAVTMLGEPFREFAGGGGLTGALQPDNHPDRWRARGECHPYSA